jgi:hypothetical protein
MECIIPIQTVSQDTSSSNIDLRNVTGSNQDAPIPVLHRGHDANMELRAITLMTLPCPPLPMMVTKELVGQCNTTDGEYHICNSHDLLANFMNIKTVVGDTGDNSKRMILQEQANSRLIEKFDKWKYENPGPIPPLDTTYAFFSTFTREYAATYIGNGGDIPDIRVSDARSIGMDHPVRVAALSFAKAQDQIYGACVPKRLDLMQYPELIQLSARRILQT